MLCAKIAHKSDDETKAVNNPPTMSARERERERERVGVAVAPARKSSS